jgi:hypothetical protein
MTSCDLVRLGCALSGSSAARNGRVAVLAIDSEDDFVAIPAGHREKVRELVLEIRALVPTDFSLCLDLGCDGLVLRVDFEDGNTGCSALQRHFVSTKGMRRTLRRIEWDSVRADGIEMEGIFDEMLRDADDRPPSIPSSEAAAEKVSEKLAICIEEVRAQRPLPAFALIVGRDDCGVAIEETLANRDEVISLVASRMTTECDILAVLERGVAWSFSEIEEAKLAAVEGLGPISRAKAERRFF